MSVYYLLLHHPGDPSEGFDVRLHELVNRKRVLARDLFHPAEMLTPNEDELFGKEDPA